MREVGSVDISSEKRIGQDSEKDPGEPSSTEIKRSVQFEVEGELLRGMLRKPPDPVGIVVLVSGDCGIAQAPREVKLAEQLFKNNVASFSIDLLTPSEASERDNRQNINLLTDRVAMVTNWLSNKEGISEIDIGYYGTDTGGSAVLQFVKYGSFPVQAIAVYNGRFDLSTTASSVPILCAVDDEKEFLMESNQDFYEQVKQSQARSEFLRTDERTEVLSQIAHWFEVLFGRMESPRYSG